MTDDSGNQLAPVETTLDLSQKAFEEVTKTGDYLGRLQLLGGNSELVKSGVVERPGVWAYITSSSDKPEVLGPTTQVMILAWRSMAMHLFNNSPKCIDFDRTSTFFKKCVSLRDVKNDEDDPDSYMAGPQFLLWAYNAKSGRGAYLTYYASSKTARKRAPEVLDLLNRNAVFGVEFIKRGKFSWHGPTAQPLSIAPPNQPDPEEAAEEIQKFLNPPKTEKEMAPEPAREV